MADDKKAEPAQARHEQLHLEPMGTEQDVALKVVGDPADRAALFAKIVAVQKKVKVLKHSGRYSQGGTNYTYATERDVLEPISQAFAKEGVAIVPGVVDSWWHDMPSKWSINRVTTVQIQAILGDANTGAYIITGARSTAANSDKATNAAFTTAFKYLLAKLAIVAFGDDADEYSVDGEKVGGAKPKAAVRTASKATLDALMEEVKSSDKGDAVKAWLKANRISWSKLTDSQIEDMKASDFWAGA